MKTKFCFVIAYQVYNNSNIYSMVITTHWERCRSEVECLLMVRRVIGSIPHGGFIEVYLVPTSATRLV